MLNNVIETQSINKSLIKLFLAQFQGLERTYWEKSLELRNENTNFIRNLT